MKRSKDSVHYRLGGPHCHACTHFSEDDKGKETMMGWCELVAGPINEHQVCDLFKRAKMGKGLLG